MVPGQVGCSVRNYFSPAKILRSQDLPFGGTKMSGYGRFGNVVQLVKRVRRLTRLFRWTRRVALSD